VPAPGSSLPKASPARALLHGRDDDARTDTLPGVGAMLVPGTAIALVPVPPAGPWDWRGSRGKTHAAAHLATSLQRSGDVTLVAWVDASSRMSLLDGLAAAAAQAGLDAEGGAEAVARRFASWLGRTTLPWLVVLDDLRDAGDLAGLWPAGPAGITVVSAGDPAAVARTPAQPVPVGCLSDREAVAFLSGSLSTDPDHRVGALDLAIALRGEPAALAHAAAVISTSELGCRQYLDLFAGRKAILDARSGDEAPAAEATWKLSVQHAEILEPGAGTWPLLVVASLLSAHGIPVDVLTSEPVRRFLADGDARSTVSLARARAAVEALHAAGLLAPGMAGRGAACAMSPALQASVRSTAGPGLLSRAAAVAADALAERWQAHGHTGDGTLLRSCALALRLAAGDALWASGCCHRALVAAGCSLDRAGLVGPAVDWWRQLAIDNGRLLGQGHADTVTAYGQLAQALLAAGQPAEAIAAAERSLAQRLAAQGDDHPGTIKVATTLGRALAATGRLREAVAVLSDVAGRGDLVPGIGSSAVIAAQDAHAAVLLDAGRPGEAARLLRRLLAAREGVLGPRDPGILSAAGLLADALAAGGQAGAAIGVHEDIVSRLERLHGPDHLDVLAARSQLASAHAAAGDVGGALFHSQQVYTGMRAMLGDGHRKTLAAAAGLARAHAGAGQMTAAMSLITQAITQAEESLPLGDPQLEALRQAIADMTGQAAR